MHSDTHPTIKLPPSPYILRWGYLSVFVLLFLFSGCNMNAAAKKRITTLNDTLTQYEVALRWASYRTAHTFHKEADKGRSDFDTASLAAIKITSINVVEVLFSEGEKEAVVLTEVKYYKDSNSSVKTIMLKHNWSYNEKMKRWLNSSAFPKFK